MADNIRLRPTAERHGKILFAGMMHRADKREPVNALAYLAPNLQKAGYEVVVSNAETFPRTTIRRDKSETARALSILRREIAAEKPDFVAFPTYDNNAPFVKEAADIINGLPNHPALIFGAPFITINHVQSEQIFGVYPNVIMVNGEAENALPLALQAFSQKASTSAAGIFVKRNGMMLGANFHTRVSLSAEEHQAIEPNFDINASTFKEQGGINIVTSRGCFEGCTFCAASWVFRPRHVSWTTDKKIAVIKQAHEWLRARGVTDKTSIGFHDDNAFYDLRQAIDFLQAFGQDPISSEIELIPQLSLGALFHSDGRFAEEVPNYMLRPDGTPFVRRISVGVDYWSSVERAVNKGGRQGRLSDAHIRTAVKSFTDKNIMVHAYWLLGDEQTTVTSFTQGLLFLSELLLDHGPYFLVDDPEPIELRTGTPIRKRVVSARNELPPKYLVEADFVGKGSSRVAFYEPIFPRPRIIRTIYELIASIQMMHRDQFSVRPEQILSMMWAIDGKWQNEVMNQNGRNLVAEYLKLRKTGKDAASILRDDYRYDFLPAQFSFFGTMIDFKIEELLEMSEAVASLPGYYGRGGHDFEMERQRRNPDFEEKVRQLLARGSM